MPAECMMEVEWDPRLMDLAQQHADSKNEKRKSYVHDERYDTVGQAIYTQSSAKVEVDEPLFAQALNDWTMEFLHFRGQANKHNYNFYQLFYDKSEKIGCGHNYYLNGSVYVDLLVCYFAPGAEFVDPFPYKEGEPNCTGHGHYLSFPFMGLCRKKFVHEDDLLFAPNVSYEKPEKVSKGHKMKPVSHDKLPVLDERIPAMQNGSQSERWHMDIPIATANQEPPPISSSPPSRPTSFSLALPLSISLLTFISIHDTH